MVDLSYQASVEPEALPGRPYPRLPDEVSPQAYGVGVGQSVEQASGEIARVHDQMVQQARQTQLSDAHNQAQALSLQLTHDPNTGAFTRQGKDAFGLTQQYLPQFQKGVAQIAQGIADPKARLAFQTSVAPQLQNQLVEQLDTHELSQHKAYADQTDQNAVEIAGRAAAANYNNPNIIASNHDTIGYTIDQMGQRNGWSPETIEATKDKAYSKFHTDVIDSMLTDNKIPMAQQYLNTARAQGGLDAHTALTLQDMINSRVKEQQNDQKQGIMDKYQDSLQAAQYGLKNPVTVSRAEMDIAFPKDAQRRWDGLMMVAAAGAKAKQFDQMTPDAIQATVDKAKPTQGGPEASFAINSYETLARAAQESIRARVADPGQFAIDNGAWRPLDFGNATNMLAQIRSRANTRPAVSEQSGVNTPLLSKQEAKQFTNMLSSQPPEDRMQTLTALRGTLYDQNYAALLKQVMPNSPLTAIAGTLVDQPPKGQTPAWYDPNHANDPNVGVRMLEGEQILREKDEKGIKSPFPMPQDKDLQPAFASAIGGANSDLFRGRPESLEAYYAAFKAVYAAEANRAGKANGVIDSTIAQRAASEVIGNVAQYEHSTVRVPSGMDPTRFEGAVNQATQRALTAAGYDAKDQAALRGYGLRELGDTLGTGRYVIINGNGDPLKSRSGQTITINLNGNTSPTPEEPTKISGFAGKGGRQIGVGDGI